MTKPLIENFTRYPPGSQASISQEELHEFADLVFAVALILRLNRLSDTVANVRFQNDALKRFQSRSSGATLHQNVSAISALLNHSLDSRELALDSAQSPQSRAMVRMNPCLTAAFFCGMTLTDHFLT
jgi:hypothetical protein